MNKERFFKLIEKYKQGSISQAEYQELLNKLNQPGIEVELDRVLGHHWKILESFSPLEHDSINSEALPTDFPPGIKQGQPINDSMAQPLNKLSTQRYIWWGFAASLILAIGFFLYLSGVPDILRNPEVVYQTGFGERQELTLNDGSLITLNANSEIRWKENWESTGSREAILEGEAFFEVKKQKGITFTVRTDDVSVEVLGTSFNIDSRTEKTEVYLEEGIVNLKLIGKTTGGQSESEKEIIMKPGDQFRYNAKNNKIELSEGQNMISAAAWKNNVLNFKNMQFSEVLDLLRDIYGQSFECSNGELLRTPMYLGVPYSDWEAVRQALELSLNIEFQRVENRRYKVIRINN